MKIWLGSFAVVLCLFNSSLVSAKASDAQGRLFAGGVVVSPTNVNAEAQAQGLKKISATLLVGLEATYPVGPILDLGIRYMKNQVSRDEDPSDLLSNDRIYITQDLMMLVGRIPLVKSNFIRLDAFGGWGGAMASTLKIETDTQQGELKKGPFESVVSSYGASLSLGYKSFYVFVEAGQMTNTVGGFTKSGTMNDNIKYMDLTGPYTLVGISFTGLAEK